MVDSDFHAVVETLMRPQTRADGPAKTVETAAVLGAGPLGRLLACAFLAAGTRVRLFSAFGADLDPLREQGAITVRGAELSGTYRVAERAQREPAIELAANVDTAVRDADVVLIAAPAWTHDIHAGLLAGQLRAGQAVVLAPGRFLGSVAFARILRRQQAVASVPIAELDTPPYLVSQRKGVLHVHGVAGQVTCAALPAADAEPLVDGLRAVLPNVTAAPSVLDAAFSGTTALLRAIPVLLAASEVERAHTESRPVLLRDLITPGLATSVLRRVDAERRRVAFRYGVRDVPSVADQVAAAFGGGGADLAAVVRSSETFDELTVPTGPGGGPHVAEEVPYGLIPLASAGRAAGVPTPVTDSLVGLASALAGADFVRDGRTMAALALDGVAPEELRRLLDGANEPAFWQVS